MGAPVSIDNLIVHVMALEDCYDLKNKKSTIHKPSDLAI